MSFVDLMASDVWSEADITRRTEALVRAEFSAERETILNRKVSGALAGQYQLTEAEQAEVALFQRVTLAAKQAGEQARADMALLLEVFDVEAAARRLARPVVEPEMDEAGNVTNQEAINQDAAERAAAQAAIDGASPDARALYVVRNPPQPEPQDTAHEAQPEPTE